ncbi:MAG: dihydrodipicolinate synthase family protein [Planctomycetota bacterium]|jgi:4-hydroxy-tetrahydrodipicolinate synthase|nr:MAG: dihydrodipicolinate synthase family protein [Planctomycetota bacterium]
MNSTDIVGSPFCGVIPALITPFREDDSLCVSGLAKLTHRMLDAGCTGCVWPGSLGEGQTLSFDERVEGWRMMAAASEGKGHAFATISAASTRDAVKQIEVAASIGMRGCMILPPYVHKGSWNEYRTHFEAMLAAAPLPMMLYNNPAAYIVDVSAEQTFALADKHANLVAVKDSSGDARRLTALIAGSAERARPVGALVGLDDCAVEGARMGACGWIAGLANAMPHESVRLFALAQSNATHDVSACDELYRWFLPLLRLDTTSDFVQLIKLVMAQMECGDERVRAPRLPVEGAARARAIELIRHALSHRPKI